MMMKNSFTQEILERMVHKFLVSFILPCNTVHVSVPVCVICTTIGPMGKHGSPLRLLLITFHSRFWALMLKPKRRRKKTQHIQMKQTKSSNSAILCVLY